MTSTTGRILSWLGMTVLAATGFALAWFMPLQQTGSLIGYPDDIVAIELKSGWTNESAQVQCLAVPTEKIVTGFPFIERTATQPCGTLRVSSSARTLNLAIATLTPILFWLSIAGIRRLLNRLRIDAKMST